MAMSTQGVVSRCCDAFLLKCHREERSDVANSNTVFIVSKARQFIERKKLHLKSKEKIIIICVNQRQKIKRKNES
jgi:hypothetical protein